MNGQLPARRERCFQIFQRLLRTNGFRRPRQWQRQQLLNEHQLLLWQVMIAAEHQVRF